MAINITIDPRSRASDEVSSSESGDEVTSPSTTRRHEYDDLFDEWAHLPYPDKPKPRDSSGKPRRRGRSRHWEAAPSSFAVSRQDDWLISSGDNDKDITTHLNLDIALDLEHELESLARLNRLGHFKKGIRYFEERLAPYVDFFPVVAEYADLLLEQGNFGHLQTFISGRLEDPHVEYLEEEVILLKTLRASAEIHTKGALIPALNMAKEALSYLSMKRQGRREAMSSPGLKCQLLETCVRIIAYAREHSNFLETEPFHSLLHWSVSNFGAVLMPNHDYQNDCLQHKGLQGNNTPNVIAWYRLLLQGGFFWDAHRILRAILPMLAGPHRRYTPDGGLENFAQMKDVSEVVDVFLQSEGVRLDDEQLLLAELANATLLASFLDVPSFIKDVRVTYGQISRRSHSLASTILLEHPHLVNTQPYLNWLLSESTRTFSAFRRPPWPINMSSLSPEMPTYTSVRPQYLQARNPASAGKTAQPEVTNNSRPIQTFETIMESARDLGDYRLERSVLEEVFEHSLDWDRSLQIVRRLSQLNQDTMNDACGYLKCLFKEFFVLENHSVPHAERLRKELDGRFSAFDRSFPFRFDHDTAAHQDWGIVSFDSPLLKWMERRILYVLLSEIGRDREAELVRLQLPQVVQHLPRDFQPRMDSTAMDSSRTDDKAPKDTPKSARYRSSDRSSTSAGYKTPDAAPGPSDMRRDGLHRIPRAILQDPYRSETAGDDTRFGWSLERLIRQGRDAERAKEAGEFVNREKEALKQERLRLTEEITRFGRDLRNAEEMTRETEKSLTSLVTFKDPVGREFKLPFNQCRSFAAMEKLMKQVFRSDTILGPHIARGDYQLTSPDGTPITRDSWDSGIQPGGTIIIHIMSSFTLPLPRESEGARTELDQPLEGERPTSQGESHNIGKSEGKQDQGPRVDDVSDSST
ncbi:hypothetical protein ASPBRDRAFT_70444 [Aspergillus brasiliensis CBS 101740]|uniref:Ubiquitin-like domain-containing protein n=1 Tax=Aspergillus brasiliensis (strain CBS 101740 / IMI 381727 / IBT 21946) TaxID=767769 RepID=A0A1L9UYU5_ASPBC|nr:hypothetical protein ASPBRDRAFT_70444 [Aspergillus brasiliensis CBS 101740]